MPYRVDLKTGQPLPDDPRVQVSIPDAVHFDQGRIVDLKPVDRPIWKDRQEIIRLISAFQVKMGKLPDEIRIERYDRATGAVVRVDVYAPPDFLLPQAPAP